MWPRRKRLAYIVGGVASPYSFIPQQAMVVSVFTPQMWWPPALTEINVPTGGVGVMLA
jgi:hypothetical protein